MKGEASWLIAGLHAVARGRNNKFLL